MNSTAQSIPARFEEQVSAGHDRVAIRVGDRSVSYGAINQIANRVAWSLQSVDTETVAVLLRQGASIVCAMLGVLKAGKVFVPLDPRQPAARMLQILEDSDASVLITDRSSMGAAEALFRPNLKVINMDDLDDTLPSHDLGLPIKGEALACLMYTSGSTGAPKGVMLSHANLVHKVDAYADVLRLDHRDRIAQLAPCSVSQGLTSAGNALLNGASLHPFDLNGLGVGELSVWLKSQDITVFAATASTFRHFARTLTAQDEFPSVRLIRVGSEQMFPDDVRLFRQHFPRGCVLVGTLGSTEAGAVATYAMDHDSVIADTVPAGYPMPGSSVKILDEDGSTCPPGEPGEIVVHNNFLCQGYWRDPVRTAGAFIDVPSEHGKRYYRTGDIGKMRADGCLEYVGRRNLRVKIRGFRVEVEEVERTLCGHPSVLDAAVVVEPDNAGDARLAAFVVSRTGRSLPTDDLCAYIGARLPPQMVPASFEFLTSLPRTASGKLHRTALPRETPPLAPQVGRAPHDAVEMCITHLWEDLLQQHPIGVTEDFFALGGHSLLAARLSASIERTFGIKLPLATFFTAATIERQADLLRERSIRKQWPLLVPIRSGGAKPPLFCVHLLDGNILGYRDLVRHLPPDRPLYGLQSRGLDGTSPLHTRIEDMARDYVAAMRKVRPVGPYAICGWSFAGIVALEMARQLEEQGQVVTLLAMLDTPARAHRNMRGSRFVQRLSRVRVHAKALLTKRNRLVYLRKKLRIVRRSLEAPLWGLLMQWYHRGGWLPRPLRNIKYANRHARRHYVLRPYSGRVALFRVHPQPGQHIHDPLLGWGSLATGHLELHEVPGAHSTMVFEPHVRQLAHELTRCLEEAWNGVDATGNSPSGTGRDGDRAA